MEDQREKPARTDEGSGKRILYGLFLHRKLFWFLTVLILLGDLWTKDLAISFVNARTDGNLFFVCDHWFALVDVTNQGGPWGLGSDYAEILRIARLLALGFILYILFGTPRSHIFQVICLAMVMGGALGNIWDSWIYGHVRDFLYFDLDFYPADPWPAFNLADSMICLGVAGLILVVVRGSMRAKSSKTGQES